MSPRKLQMNLFLIISINNVFCTEIYTNSFFYFGFDKGKIAAEMRGFIANSIARLNEKMSEVRERMEMMYLRDETKLHLNKDFEEKIMEFVDDILDLSQVVDLPDRQFFLNACICKNDIREAYQFYSKEEHEEKSKNEMVTNILKLIEENIIKVVNDRNEYARSLFNEVSITRNALIDEIDDSELYEYPEFSEVQIEYILEDLKFDALNQKLILIDIPIDDFFAENNTLIEKFKDFFDTQLKNRPTENIFIVLDFEVYVISLLIAMSKHNRLKEHISSLDIHVYKQMLRDKLSIAEDMENLYNYIDENPWLHVLSSRESHPYMNWIYILSSISTTAGDLEYFINELRINKKDITELSNLLDQYIKELFYARRR